MRPTSRSRRVPTLLRVLLLTACLALAAAPAQAQGRNVFEQIGASTFDVLILRPLGTVQVAVGAVLFVPMVGLSWPSGEQARDQVYQKMITIPVESTFQRPLGEF